MNDFIAVIARYMGRAFAWGTGWWAMWGPGCLVTAGDQPGSGGTANPVTGYHWLSPAVTGCHRLSPLSPAVTGCHRLSPVASLQTAAARQKQDDAGVSCCNLQGAGQALPCSPHEPFHGL